MTERKPTLGGAVLPVSASACYAALGTELQELETALDVPTTRSYDRGAAVPLRQALQLQAGRVSHEVARLALVARAPAGADPSRDAAALVAELGDAAALLVSAAQLLTRAGECGRTLRADVRGAVRGVLRAVASATAPLAAGTAAHGGAGGDVLLYHAGLAMRLCDDVKRLPTGDMAAVKRRVLSAATSACNGPRGAEVGRHLCVCDTRRNVRDERERALFRLCACARARSDASLPRARGVAGSLLIAAPLRHVSRRQPPQLKFPHATDCPPALPLAPVPDTRPQLAANGRAAVVKQSIEEIASDHGVDAAGIAATSANDDPSVALATASLSISGAAAAAPVASHDGDADGDDGEGDDADDGDDDDENDDGNGGGLPTDVARRVVVAGLRVLKLLLARVLKPAAALAGAAGSAVAAAPTGSASTLPLSPSPSPPSANALQDAWAARDALDVLADAAGAVRDAAIDVAAAVNEAGDRRAVIDGAAALDAAIGRLAVAAGVVAVTADAVAPRARAAEAPGGAGGGGVAAEPRGLADGGTADAAAVAVGVDALRSALRELHAATQ